MRIPQEECLTRAERGAKFCYMSGTPITSTNRSCSGPCRTPSTRRGKTAIYTHVLNRRLGNSSLPGQSPLGSSRESLGHAMGPPLWE